MSKPAHGMNRPADGRADPDPSREEIAVINERDRDYPAQREAARPASEVMERLLRRHVCDAEADSIGSRITQRIGWGSLSDTVGGGTT